MKNEINKTPQGGVAVKPKSHHKKKEKKLDPLEEYYQAQLAEFRNYDPVKAKASRPVFYVSDWGPKLYESSIALDIKNDNELLNRTTGVERELLIKKTARKYEDYLNNPVANPVMWIIMADQEMENKSMTQRLKDRALKAIDEDLVNWKKHEKYEERKIELNKFRKKLESYIVESK